MRNTSEIMVSVFCMAYNHERFIHEALDGILKQDVTFRMEIIVHDDLSTDRTGSIIREYAMKYPMINPIFQDENQFSKAGIYPVVALYSAARGKYIAECDADDYWTDPQKLQKQVWFMEANPEFSMCYHDYLMLRDGKFSEPSTDHPRDFTPDELVGYDNRGYGMATCTKLYRNVITPDQYRYFDNFCPDYILDVLMGMVGGCKYIPGIEPSIYRKWGGNTWSGRPFTQERYRAMCKKLYSDIAETGNQHYIDLRAKFL